MTYEATIQNVTKHDDELIIEVEYTDGVKSYMKTYPWVHMIDINTNFDETVKMELKRINDLELGFTTMEARIGEKILSSVVLK